MATEIEVEHWLPISEVADRLKTGRDYVANRIKAGELPCVDLGKKKPKLRVPESGLNAFIASRTFKAAS